MKWEKKGKICDWQTLDLPWYKKNSMVPLPYLKDKNTLRIFLTMCDKNNIGRIGFVDVNPDNPSEIKNFSKEPVIDIGMDGHFDDNGVVTASLFEEDGKLYMFYSGYQSCIKIPYMIFTGLAVSQDGGDSFQKLTTDVPILDRSPGEVSTRCVPYVMKEESKYKMWYTSDFEDGWINIGNKKAPIYDMKYLESDNIMEWGKKGETAVTFKNQDEHGIAKCTVWVENSEYHVIYSIRNISQGYRLGYAKSLDGINFVRMDEKVGIDVSEEGFDSEMICFAERIEYNDKIYLFYSGNHYGMEGIGYAELVRGN